MAGDKMQDELRISVIVPTLNEEANIGPLLESLKTQHCPPYEVIVVDGGSTDATIAIAETYGARVEVRPGLKEFPSRALGARMATGAGIQCVWPTWDCQRQPGLLATMRQQAYARLIEMCAQAS